jgi:hypothetical protein
MGIDGDDTAFGDALERLRRSGSALLVVGAVPDAVHRQASTELLGGPDRDRVLIRAGDRQVDRPAPAASDHVIEYESGARGAAAADASGTGAVPSGGPGEADTGETTATQRLASTVDAVETALDTLDGSAAGDPRVCVDSLLALVDASDEEAAFQFLHLVTERVRSLGGTAHFHLASPPDGSLATTFEPLADATVELRLSNDAPQQRWTVHEAEMQSDWLPLSVE